MPRKTYFLKADFGLGPTKSSRTIGMDMQLAEAKGMFPRMYQRMTTKGPMFLNRPLTDTEFMALTWFDACWGEAVWQGQGGGQPIETGYLSSSNQVEVPEGTYMQSIPAEFSSGEYNMQGPGYTDVNNDSMNTKLAIYHEGWLGAPDKRHGLVSGTWGVSGSSLGYIEGTRFNNFRMDGRQDASQSIISQKFESYGLMLWKTGEMSDISRIWFENYRTSGMALYQPTPANIGNISAFQCVESGIRFLGSWGGTVNIDLLSSDACGAMFDMVSMNGEAGGCINFGAIKNETMVASQGRSWRGQCVGVLRGQFCVNIGVLSGAVGGGRLPALFVVDDRLTNGTPQGSYLEFRVKGFNYEAVVHDIRRGEAYPSPGDYQSGRFEYNTASGEMYWRNSRMMPRTAQAKYRVNHRVGGSGPLDMGTSAPAYREIVVGPPAFSTTVYLNDVVSPPAPTCSWVLGQPGPWSECVNGEQTRTTPYISSLAGCTPVEAKPSDLVEKLACTPPPPPPPPAPSTIVADDVLVVANSADARSAVWAAEYAAAWGIPSGNIVNINAGSNHDCSSTIGNAIRTVVEGKGKQYTVLAWEYPSRVGAQSITSFVTFGQRNVNNLTKSSLYQYTGFKPRTDKGVAPAFLLLKNSYIRKDANATKPVGQSILLLAKDQTGTPRGSARANQGVQGVSVWDNRTSSNIGSGNNACNYISNGCWVSGRKPGTTPVVAGYQSMFQLGDDGGTIWAKGFYGDHVTSFGGYLPAGSNGLNSQGQTPLTYHLDRGASMSCGTVSEPWQNTNGTLPQQFVNVTIFHPLFVGGMPVGVATWAAVQCPDRLLFAGDPLCAPYA